MFLVTCVHTQEGPCTSSQDGFAFAPSGQPCFSVLYCILFIYFCLHWGTWKSEGNFALDFHHVSSGNRTQVFGLGSKFLYELSPLACPAFVFQKLKKKKTIELLGRPDILFHILKSCRLLFESGLAVLMYHQRGLRSLLLAFQEGSSLAPEHSGP